jgi:hypothetical protein
MNAIEIYISHDREPQVEVRFDNDSVWLSQAQIADLFQRDRTVVSRHINNVFKEKELDENEVHADFPRPLNMAQSKGKL